MKKFKQRLVRIVLLVEIVVVMGFYIFGAQGLLAYRDLQQSVHRINADVKVLAAEIGKLERQHKDLLKDPFYIERYAREKLAMARDNEQIYVIK